MTREAQQYLDRLIDNGTYDPDQLMAALAAFDREHEIQWKGSFRHRVIGPLYNLFGQNIGSIDDPERQARWRRVAEYVGRSDQPTEWPGFDKFQHFIVGAELGATFESFVGPNAGIAAGIAAELIDEGKRITNTFLDYFHDSERFLQPHQIGFDPVDAEYTTRGAAFSQIASRMPESGMSDFATALQQYGVSTFFEPPQTGWRPSLGARIFDSIADWFDYADRYDELELPEELLEIWSENAETIRRLHARSRLGVEISGQTDTVDTVSIELSDEFYSKFSLLADNNRLASEFSQPDSAARAAREFSDIENRLQTQLTRPLARKEIYNIRAFEIAEQHAFLAGLNSVFEAFGLHNDTSRKVFGALELIGRVRSISLALQFSQIGAMAAFSGYAGIISAAVSLFSTGSGQNQIAQAMQQVMSALSDIYKEVRLIRQEMHARFDRIETQLRELSIQLGILQQSARISDSQQRRALDRIEILLRKDLKSILDGQYAIRRDLINLEIGRVLGDIDTLIQIRRRDRRQIEVNEYFIHPGNARNVMEWLDNNGRQASRFMFEREWGPLKKLLWFASSTHFRGRKHYNDGEIALNARLVGQFLIDGNDITPISLAPEIFQMAVVSYRDLALSYPEFHFSIKPGEDSSINTKADIKELIRFGQNIIQNRLEIFNVEFTNGEVSLDIELVIALFDILKRIANEMRQEVTRLQRVLVNERSGEFNGFDPFLFGPGGKIARPGQGSNSANRDVSLAIYRDTESLKVLRDELSTLVAGGHERFLGRRVVIRDKVRANVDIEMVRRIRRSARLPALQLARLEDRMGEFRAKPKGYSGKWPQNVRIPKAWLERLPVPYIILILSKDLSLRASYDPTQLVEHWMYYAGPMGDAPPIPPQPMSRVWDGKYMRNGTVTNSREFKSELSGKLRITIELIDKDKKIVLRSVLNVAIGKQVYKVQYNSIGKTRKQKYKNVEPKIAAQLGQKVEQFVKKISFEDFRKNIEIKNYIMDNRAFSSWRSGIIDDLKRELVKSTTMEDIKDDAELVFHIIDEGLMKFVDPLNPGGQKLLKEYVEARQRLSLSQILIELDEVSKSLDSGEYSNLEKASGGFFYGLGGYPLDSLDVASWEVPAAAIAALSSLSTRDEKIVAIRDETQQMLDILEDLNRFGTVMSRQAEIEAFEQN